MNDVLDVIDFQRPTPDAEVARLIEARNQARQAKDYLLADTLREQLQSMGVRLTDNPSGTAWKKSRSPIWSRYPFGQRVSVERQLASEETSHSSTCLQGLTACSPHPA